MNIVNNTLQLFLCRARTSLHDTQILLNGSARLGNQPVNNRTTPHWVVDRHRTLIHLPAAYTIILRLVTLAEQPTQSIFRDLAISKRSSIMQAATFEQQMGVDKLPTHMLEQLLQLLGVLIQLQKNLSTSSSDVTGNASNFNTQLKSSVLRACQMRGWKQAKAMHKLVRES